MLLQAPPGYFLTELKEHLVDEHHGAEWQLGDDQRSLGALWMLVLPVGDGEELRVTASRCPMSWPSTGVVLGAAELGVAEADLPAHAPPEAAGVVASSEGWPEYLALLARSGVGATGGST